MQKRYKILFENEEALEASLAADAAPGDAIKVVSRKRLAMSVAQPARLTGMAFDGQLDTLSRNFGARVVEEYVYDLEALGADSLFEAVEASAEGSLDDVLDAIKARNAWQHSRGSGVTIAVVDTGIDGTRREFPDSKRAGHWVAQGDQPWTDWEGHGTMCACIAAGTRSDGGAFDGVAPDAKIIACKTRFFELELADIYDMLTDRAKQGEVIVATNSFGRRTGTPPTAPGDNKFLDALNDAIAAGVHVFFSGGNNHQLAGGAQDACNPNSIWLHKSRTDVMAVATCNLEEAMWFYSSRGPGQHFGEPNTNHKPDVTAPTPRNGEIVYGSDIRVLPNGWGTSGACPQAAGLAALLLTLEPSMSRADLFSRIHETARGLGHGRACEGAGMIDCDAAIATLLRA